MKNENILTINGINKSFFGAQVLFDIDLNLKKGEILGLVGENGAGKSTLMNILGGVLQPNSGSMMIEGNVYTPTSPKDAQEAKIAFIHQELSLFSNLSIAENLYIEDLPTTGVNKIQYKKMYKEAKEHLKAFEIEINPKTKVEALQMGVRQTVEITKALVRKAKIVIFDEPTTSLSQKEKQQLFKSINNLKAAGVSIIYISHILEDVFELCDRISVLRDGNVVGTKPTKEVKQEEIIKMMVGRELSKVYPEVDKSIEGELFRAEHITQGKKLRDISFQLNKGEIIGFFGLMGAGRTELMRVLFGLDKFDSGEIYFNGKGLKRINPSVCIKKGIAFITEDRRQEGLLMPKPVDENIILVKMKDILSKLGVVNKKKTDLLTDKSIKELNIKVQDKKLQLAQNLSGGNQQKVVIGKWLLNDPTMLIMDEPTRGVDVGAKFEIYTIINRLAKQGSGVLFVSSEMEELMGVCDRILIIRNGRITGEISKNEYDQEVIMKYALEERKAQ